MRLSVIMPVYNAAEYLQDAIESILQQTYSDFEFNIIDDGSTDGSYDIIAQYARTDARIHCRSRENRGLPATLNELIDMSSGQYLARMDADDIAYPTRLEKQLAYMDANPDVAVLGTAIRVMRGDSLQDGPIRNDYRYTSQASRQIRMIFYNTGVAHPTALLRRSFLEEHGLSYQNVGSEDYMLWCDIISAGGRIEELSEPLLSYRLHPGQITQVTADKVIAWDNTYRLELMSRLVDLRDEDEETLGQITCMTRDANLDAIYELFNRMLEGNRSRQIYPTDTLQCELAIKWIIVAGRYASLTRSFVGLRWKYLRGLWKMRYTPELLRCMNYLRRIGT